MTTLGVGRYNAIMGENLTADNNALMENQQNLLSYHTNQKDDKLIEEGENQKIGAQDAGAATSAISNFARFAVRKSESGKSFAQLASEDLGFKTTPSAPAETFNTIQTSTGDVPRTLPNAGQAAAEDARTVPEAAATEGPAATGTVTEAAAETTTEATSAVADAGATAAKTATSAVADVATAAKTATEVAETTAKAVAGKAAFWGGKALGNIGGAIDLVKDIQSAASGGNFFGGSGKSLTDEIGNGLSLAGSVLDVAGIGLPFLEPLGAALTVAGGITETIGGLADQTKMEGKTTSDFTSGIVKQLAPQAAAGLGFIASAPTNPMKMITGSSTF